MRLTVRVLPLSVSSLGALFLRKKPSLYFSRKKIKKCKCVSLIYIDARFGFVLKKRHSKNKIVVLVWIHLCQDLSYYTVGLVLKVAWQHCLIPLYCQICLLENHQIGRVFSSSNNQWVSFSTWTIESEDRSISFIDRYLDRSLSFVDQWTSEQRSRDRIGF